MAAATSAVAAGLVIAFIILLLTTKASIPGVIWVIAAAAAASIMVSAPLTFGLLMSYSERTEEYERSLIEAHETLHAFMMSTPIPLISLGADGRVKTWNTAAKDALGWREEEVIGNDLDMWATAGGRLQQVMEMVKEGVPVASEGIQLKTKGGERKDFGLTVAPIRNSKAQVTGLAAALIDFGNIRRTEEALRESQRVLSTLMSNLPGMAYRRRNDEDWTMEFASEGCLPLTGFPASALMEGAQKTYAEMILPEDLPRLKDEVRSAVAEGRPYTMEYGITTAGGALKYVWEQGRCVDRKEGSEAKLEGLILDITERRKVDMALRAEEERYRQLVESVNSIIMQFDTEGRILSANSFAERFFGFSRDELVGMKASETIIPRIDSNGIDTSTLMSDIIRDPLRYANSINENVKKDGSRVWVHWANRLIRDPSGEPSFLLAVGTDITELTQAQHALEESEHRYRQLVEFSPDAILVYIEGKIVFANAAGDALMRGSGSESILGRDWSDFLDPVDAAIFRGMFKGDRESTDKVSSLEASFHRLDGSVADVEVAGIPVSYRGNPAVLIVARDVTQRKLAEKESRAFEERLSALHFYDTELISAKNLMDVYEITMDAVQRIFGFDRAFFARVRGEYLERVAGRGSAGTMISRLPLDGSKGGIIVRAARTKEPVLVPDSSKDEGYVAGIPGVNSELAVPVEFDGRTLGVIDVESLELDAFDLNDVKLIQILASHMATAIGNLEQHSEIEKTSTQLAFLLRSSAEILRAGDVHERLQKIAGAISELGWRRVVISARDENLNVPTPEDLVTAGLTEEERDFIWKTASSGDAWRDRFGPEFDRFKMGSFYYLPWSDPFVKERMANIGVSSKLTPDQMVDWGPQDLLYTPLSLPDGRVVGILSVDDPIDGKKPTKASLAPLGLFIGMAALALESARLFRALESARNEIREHAGQLERKVEERSRELEEAHEKLLQAQRLATIGEVAAQVGHDLRNPLTAINTNLYYLNNVMTRKQRDRVDVTLESIQNAVSHANRIVEDLLEYSQTTGFRKTNLMVKPIVLSSLGSIFIPNNISVTMTLQDAEVYGDRARLMRVFQNLMSNAVDAMPDGGSLRLSSILKPTEITVSITDTGVGVSEKDLPMLFTPFFTTKSKGLGLGLAICKRLVEAHGGRIEVKSRVGEGTSFSVTLPRGQVEEQPGEV